MPFPESDIELFVVSRNWSVDGSAVGEVEETADEDEVAMTRKVVRSNMMTSVALQASANIVKCFASDDAFGMSVWTIRDHA